MTDFATLVLGANTAGLKKGARDLDSLAATGEKTEKRVTGSLKKIEGAANAVPQATDNAANGMTRAQKAAAKLGISAKSAQMGMRMLPYQLNQIAQSGAVTGRWMTSVTTQIPDILAGFGSMQLVLAGGAAAMGAAFIPALMGTSASASDLSDQIEAAEDALDAYRSAAELAGMSTKELEAKFGSAGASMQTLLTVIEDLKRREGQRAIDDLSSSLSDLLAVAGDGEKRGIIAEFFDVNIFMAFSEKGREARDVARQLTGQFLGAQQALDFAETIENSTDRLEAQIAAAEQLLNVSISLAEADGKRNKEEDDLISKIAESLQQMRMLRGAVEDTANSEAKRAEAAQEIVDKFNRQAEMANAIAAYGEDSAAVEALRRAEAIRTAEAMIEQKGLTGEVAQNVRDAALAAFDAETNSRNAAEALREAEAAAKGLASAIASAAGFSLSLENGVRVLEVQITALQSGADAAIASTIEGMRIKAEQMRQSQIAAGQDKVIADAQYALDVAAIDRQAELLAQKKAIAEANRQAAKTGGAASKNSLAGLLREIDQRTKLIGLTDQQRKKYEAVLDVQRRLGKEVSKVSAAQVEFLADQLVMLGETEAAMQRVADLQGQWSEEITRTAFEGGDLGDVVDGILRDIQLQLANTQLVLPIVATVTDVLGLDQLMAGSTAVSTATGGGSGSGLVGGLLGSGGVLGGLSSGVGIGLSNLVTGGVGSYFGGLGAQAGMVFANGFSASALGGLLGMAAPLAVVGAVLAKGLSQKYAGTALRGTLDMSGFDGTSFDWYRGGFLRGDKATYKDVPDELQLYLDTAMTGVVDSIGTYADALGLNAKKMFEATGDEFTIWLNKLSDEEIIQALNDEVEEVSNTMAQLVLGTTRFTRPGETAMETLERLGAGIAAVNDAADLLGHRVWGISLASADAASELVDLFGGVEAMTSAVSTYWQTMYSDAERQETMVRRLTETFTDLGYAMPRTRDQYRTLVESIDTSTEAGRELYATLISMASALDEVLPGVSSLTEAILALQGTTQTGLETAISAANEAAKANATAASNWYKASGSIRDYLDKLRGSTSALTDPRAARAYNEVQYQTTLASALAGDLDAAKSLTGVAENLRQSVNDTASTRVEAALAEARILSDLGLAAGVGDIEGARHDVIAGLLTDQADLMQETADYLAVGNALTEGMIATLQSQLGSLDDAIAAAELINYRYLKERLAVTVDVLAEADVPKYLRNLLTNAADGVTGYIDLLVRSDLTPDLKWLALTGASEHVKTIEYLAENRLGRDLTKLAVATFSDLEKTVHLAVGQELPDDVMRVALAGNSELSRIVNATLADDIDRNAKKLALTDISDHLVRINGKIGDGNTKAITRLLRSLGGVTDGKLTLGGSFVFDPSASFETLFGDSIEKPMDAARVAMGTLTGALVELRGAIAAETARATYQGAVDALQLKGTAAASALASTRAAQSSTAEDLTALFAEYGVSTVGGGFAVKGGQLTETADHFATSGSFGPLMKALRSSYGVKGGTVADLLSAIFDQVNDPLAGQKSTLQDLRKAYRNLTGEAASFDGGGETGSWGRSGGVDGKGGRWGILHANEKISTSSQHDELVAAVQALREELVATKKELSAFKEQSRQLDTNRGNDLRKIRLIEEARKADEEAAV